jgi:hypothetical protein
MTGPEKRSSVTGEDRGTDGTGRFESCPHRHFSIDEIRNLVRTREKWAEHAILALYSRQTQDEQRVGATKENNSVGFNGTDSVILSSFAQQIGKGRRLSPKQLKVAFKALPKYAKQLHRIAYPEES